MEDKEKICANCKNFKWFYFKHKYKLNQSNCGMCFKKKILREEKLLEGRTQGCAKWEPAETENEIQDIEEVLTQTAKRIEEIALILKTNKSKKQ